jgi:hypothetical protein
MAENMDPEDRHLLAALVTSSPKIIPIPEVHTDLELLAALQSLRYKRCQSIICLTEKCCPFDDIC